MQNQNINELYEFHGWNQKASANIKFVVEHAITNIPHRHRWDKMVECAHNLPHTMNEVCLP